MRCVRCAAVVALLVLTAGYGYAVPPAPEVPEEVKGEVGAFVAVTAKTEGDRVLYVAIDPGLNVFPAGMLADPKSTVVTAGKPGRYRLLAYSAVKGEPTPHAIVTVVIGGAPPVPPGPNPPPNPPGPTPPEPDPEMLAKLRDAVQKDGGSKDDVMKLAALYKLGAELVLKRSGDAFEVPHTAELFRRMREAGSALAGSLTVTRTVLAAELSAALGASSEAPLTDDKRQRAADTFKLISVALDALSK